jgi:hypothetical protein
MSMYLYLFAAALLTTPPELLELSDASKLYRPLGPAMRDLAMHWELLDSRETTYILAQEKDFADDLRLLQDRYHDLAHAPPLIDCSRFPDRNLISDLLGFNRAYRDALASRLEFDRVHAEDLRTAIEETDLLYRIWDSLRDARCDYYFTTYRRQALKLLRDIVGDQAYYSGQLPPHIPLWRIPIVD